MITDMLIKDKEFSMGGMMMTQAILLPFPVTVET